MPEPPPWNVVLIGFMGTGKSTVGKLLSEKLGAGFVDIDVEVVRASGKPITAIFSDGGEDAFRDLESSVLEGLAGRSGLVVSCGGGIVAREGNRTLLRKLGYVVWLTASEDTIVQRVLKNRDRPLVLTDDPRGTVKRLLAEREPLYSATHHLKIDSSDLSAEEVAFGIKECAQHFFTSLEVPTGAPGGDRDDRP